MNPPLSRRPQPAPSPLSGSDLVVVLHSTTTAWEGPRFAADLRLLPGSEQDRILRLKRGSDRRASLVGRLLLRQGLELFGHSPERLEDLRYTTYGKPFLPTVGLDFNISHSGQHVVCAISQCNRVGIDLEQIRQLPLEDLAASMDQEQLRTVARAADPSKQLLAFWTKKEAVAKCRGEGLQLPLERMSGSAELNLDGESWHCTELNVAPGYICHGVAKIPPSGWQVLAGLR